MLRPAAGHAWLLFTKEEPGYSVFDLTKINETRVAEAKFRINQAALMLCKKNSKSSKVRVKSCELNKRSANAGRFAFVNVLHVQHASTLHSALPGFSPAII